MDSERNLSAVVSAAPVAIFALDASAKCRVATGAVLSDILGIDTDPTGQDFERLLHAHEEAADALARALAGRASRATFEVGSRVAELRLSPSAGEDGVAGVTGVVMEVTERVRMERRLETTVARVERANQDLVSILDRLRAGTAIVSPEGRIRFMSKSAAEIFRIEHGAAKGEFWDQALPLSEEHTQVLRDLSGAPPEHRERTVVRVDHGDGRSRTLSVEVFDDPREEGLAIWVFYDETEVQYLRQELDERSVFHALVGRSAEMLSVYDQVRDFAGVSWTVLIEGETGTGKELVAQAIHGESPRAKKPFIAVNCAALSVSLLQSQLFGHCKGAFTGAHKDHSGYFEAADGGTLFLDEIGDISREVQVALLRVLEEGEITRMGESCPRKVDVRVICATHHDLQEEVELGNFRADLMYRIRVVRVNLPPLRTRRGDIPLLVNRFIERARAATGKDVQGITEDCLAALFVHSWPGNVRELRSAINFGAMRSKNNLIAARDLPPEFRNMRRSAYTPHNIILPQDDVERIKAALAEARGNRTKAARLLGISRATFYRRLVELSIDI
jgi:transcriptional regulator with PAS, ATPase and Fis domain